MKRVICIFLFFCCVCSLRAENAIQGKPQEIVLWHAFDGFLEKSFLEIVEDFNHHSGAYKVVAIKKGNYKDVVEKGLEAFAEKKEQPHILQVYEIATLSMMYTKGVFVPVDDLMRKHHKKFDRDVYIDAVKSFYSTSGGKMLSFPWNASTGILYYNKNAFAKAGLDPEKPPKTWEELEIYGKKLVAAGFTGFTTAWPAAYHLEHLSCWHNLAFATMANGLEGLSARLVFNGPQIYHVGKLCEWQKEGIFTYAGRFNEEPEKLFTTGKCAILFQGANRLPLLKQGASFPIGVGVMPYWAKIVQKPYTLNVGGASFWVMTGFEDATYRGIVQFFEYLSSTSIQAHWHQKTGYLPITEAAYYLTKKKGFYATHPASEIAVLEVMGHTAEYSRGIRLGNYLAIRDHIIDELENALQGKSSPKEALDNAVKSGNVLLEQFEKAHTISSSSH